MIEDALKKFNKYMADKWDEHIHKFPEADTSQWNSGFTVAQEIAENFLSHSLQEAKAEMIKAVEDLPDDVENLKDFWNLVEKNKVISTLKKGNK